MVQLMRCFVTVENGLTLSRYWSSNCGTCAMKARCTPSKHHRITRWEHQAVIEAMRRRLEEMPNAMRIRRSIVEHIFGTIKDWIGQSHFLTRKLANVATEMSLHVLAYNLKRAVAVLGTSALMVAIRG
jgi:transposase